MKFKNTIESSSKNSKHNKQTHTPESDCGTNRQ